VTESYRYQHWLQDSYFLACAALWLNDFKHCLSPNVVQHRFAVKLPCFHMCICHWRLLCCTNPLGIASLKMRQVRVTEQCLQHPLRQSLLYYGLPHYKYTRIVIILWIYKITFASQLWFSKWCAQTSLISNVLRYSTPKCRAIPFALLWFIQVQRGGWRTQINHLCTIFSLGRKFTNLQSTVMSRGWN